MLPSDGAEQSAQVATLDLIRQLAEKISSIGSSTFCPYGSEKVQESSDQAKKSESKDKKPKSGIQDVEIVPRVKGTTATAGATPSDSGSEPKIIRHDVSPPKPTKLKKVTSAHETTCLLYTSPSPRDLSTSRMPSSA